MKIICKKDLYYFGIKYCMKNKYYEYTDFFNDNSYVLIKTDVDSLSINKLAIRDYFYTEKELRILKMKNIYETNM